MMSTPSNVDAGKAARFLRRSYELERAGWGLISAFEVGRGLGLGEGGSRKICSYLAEKGFIDQIGPSCGVCAYLAEKGLIDQLSLSCGFRLSNRGIDEVEWSFARSGFLHDLIRDEAEKP